MSRREWTDIGKKAGWMREAVEYDDPAVYSPSDESYLDLAESILRNGGLEDFHNIKRDDVGEARYHKMKELQNQIHMLAPNGCDPETCSEDLSNLASSLAGLVSR